MISTSQIKKLEDLSVETTAKEVFSGCESAVMAFLIYKRFGRNVPLSHRKWMQLLQNNCEAKDFWMLVETGENLYNVLVGKK